jgi:hypothetical protein
MNLIDDAEGMPEQIAALKKQQAEEQVALNAHRETLDALYDAAAASPDDHTI